MYIYIYIRVYMYMYIYIYMHMYMYMYLSMYLYVCKCILYIYYIYIMCVCCRRQDIWNHQTVMDSKGSKVLDMPWLLLATPTIRLPAMTKWSMEGSSWASFPIEPGSWEIRQSNTSQWLAINKWVHRKHTQLVGFWHWLETTSCLFTWMHPMMS